ncbi:MAG: hormogonium polysaccharide biosynthesis protein HpsA [Cyanobacteria bacterium P01_H01_bin.26]
MSTPKRSRVSNRHRGSVSQLGQLPKQFMAWLLRLAFISARFTRSNQAGFVLPTTVLLLLIVSLTVGSLSFRAFSRSASVIAEREQQVVYGAATPAIDRAKAKLEYLFDKKVPSNSTPSSGELEAFLREGNNAPPFTLPDEKRVDLNNDGTLDNAWWFAADIDGDGSTDAANERIVYSILVNHDATDPVTSTDVKLEDRVSQAKASALVTRNGPIDVSSSGANCPVSLGTNEEGWQEISAGAPEIKKNFQINAFTVNANQANRTVSALEVQQVRESRKGSKWGAWFRNDLEAFPGEDFTWNGAMHTEGSLFLAPDEDFQLRMISSHNSCLYSETASEIELVDVPGYTGQVVGGGLGGPSESTGFITDDTDIDYFTGAGTVAGTFALDKGADSINSEPPNIEDIALDPIEVFTADRSTYRNGGSWTPENDANFWDKNTVRNRITQTTDSEPPFVDDTYRADGRFGPKATYDKSKNLELSVAQAKLGDIIADSTVVTTAQKTEIDDRVNGLDGYWEKQATSNGAKVIVGERLQLGDPFGWRGAYNIAGGDNEVDPLYPADSSINILDKQSLLLHRRSLNDNLAAVQSMAIYHYKNGGGKEYPLACMALVSHPGTQSTIDHARTFNLLPKNNGGTLSTTTGTDLVNVDFDGVAGNDATIDTDFFFGYGTNAWEYAPPLGTEGAFETAYNSNSSPLKKALKNLAFFAGDPKGAAPSFIPVQGQAGGADPFIHPYPHLAMWGDFSTLRRILEPKTTADTSGLGDPTYTNLSIADRATVQTAACTLGMLATNVRVADSLDYASADVQAALTALATEVGTVTSTPALTVNDYLPAAYISAFDRAGNDAALGLARLLHLKEQIQRDRTYGFLKSPTFNYSVTSSQTIAAGQTIPVGPVTLSFDPTVNNYFGFGAPGNAADELRFLRLAAVAGGIAGTGVVDVGLPEFPALYYLFPLVAHDYKGTGTPAVQPAATPDYEPYIDPDGDPATANNYLDTSNLDGGSLYQYQAFTDADLAAVQAEPRASVANWTLPYTTTVAGRPNIISANGTDAAILFQDKSFLDGREMLSVRTVEVDVNMATNGAGITNGQVGGQSWFTEGEANVQGGIFYAFREDARREDEILRPIPTGTAPVAKWAACNSTANILTATCRMNLDVGSEQDPPIRRFAAAADNNYINPKPVDFYPDPERRPYGFRLSNGEKLERADDVSTGLTFITDNALYVKGNFNLHIARKADGGAGVAVGDSLEEFFTAVDGNADGTIAKAEFYNNRGATAADFNASLFAKADGDDWRVVELVADAVNILSSNFNDGSVRDYFLEPKPTNRGDAVSSYQNGFRARKPGQFADGGSNQFFISNINRAYQSQYAATGNASVDGQPIWPFLIRRNGEILGTVNPDIYLPATGLFSERQKDQMRAQATRVNALLISGIVPSRFDQSYGGLHNFPRLNEFWLDTSLNGVDLEISGAFYQLNFSTASTGLFEHDVNTSTSPPRGAWEPGINPVAGDATYYYGAPKRTWGYDVAFQYVSPGPVSQRFTGNESVRSEYYRDLAADDPYIVTLQCAKETAAGPTVVVNPTVTCP